MSNVVNLNQVREQREAELYNSDEGFDIMMSNLFDILNDMDEDLRRQQEQERAHDRESFRILKANGYSDIEAQRVVKRERELIEKRNKDINRKVYQQMHEKYPDDPAYFPENWEL